MWSLAVGTAIQFELKKPHVDADLKFFLALAGADAPSEELVGLEFPTVEQVADIVIHGRAL